MDTFKPLARSLQPPTGSSRSLANAQSGADEKAAFSTERARLLLGQFRRGEANDPAVFVTSIAAVLARYDSEIVTSVTNPRTGLASRSDWLPTIREVVAACEELAGAARGVARRDAALEQQLRDRAAFEASLVRRPTMDELRRRYGPDWGLRREAKSRVRSPVEIAGAMGVRVTQADLDAIPNAPPRQAGTS